MKRRWTVAVIGTFGLIGAGIAWGMVSQRADAKEVAIAITGGDPDKGRAAIYAYGCASCHTIPGIRGANGLVGPPLTQMGGRSYIGGVMANTPANMMQWLQDPPKVDAKTAMPNLNVTEGDARDIACYLYTLQ